MAQNALFYGAFLFWRVLNRLIDFSPLAAIDLYAEYLYFLAMKYLLTVCLLVLVTACVQKPVRGISIPVLNPSVSFDVVKPKACLDLVAVGDIMLGGTAVPTLLDKGYDYPFDRTRDVLAGADIAVANLETALTHRGQPFDKKYTFRNPPEKVIPALQNAGFDLVSLANNHTVDYGEQGLQDTLQAIDGAGLAYVGAGMNQMQARQPKIIESKGQKVGFLAYSLTYPEEFWAKEDRAGTAFGHASHIKADIAALRPLVDNVVVQFHWGREGKTKLRDYQVALGRASIDAGASLVLGHHPHILQAVEAYKHGAIYYSLGNFAFGSFSNRVQVGGIAQVELCPSGLEQYALLPIDVNNFRVRFQPAPAKGELLDAAFAEIQQLSRDRATQLELESGQVIGVTQLEERAVQNIGGSINE